MIQLKTEALGAVGPGENMEEEVMSSRWVIDWKGHTIQEQFPWTRVHVPQLVSEVKENDHQ